MDGGGRRVCSDRRGGPGRPADPGSRLPGRHASRRGQRRRPGSERASDRRALPRRLHASRRRQAAADRAVQRRGQPAGSPGATGRDHFAGGRCGCPASEPPVHQPARREARRRHRDRLRPAQYHVRGSAPRARADRPGPRRVPARGSGRALRARVRDHPHPARLYRRHGVAALGVEGVSAEDLARNTGGRCHTAGAPEHRRRRDRRRIRRVAAGDGARGVQLLPPAPRRVDGGRVRSDRAAPRRRARTQESRLGVVGLSAGLRLEVRARDHGPHARPRQPGRQRRGHRGLQRRPARPGRAHHGRGREADRGGQPPRPQRGQRRAGDGADLACDGDAAEHRVDGVSVGGDGRTGVQQHERRRSGRSAARSPTRA